jgi:hypothetical protein
MVNTTFSVSSYSVFSPFHGNILESSGVDPRVTAVENDLSQINQMLESMNAAYAKDPTGFQAHFLDQGGVYSQYCDQILKLNTDLSTAWQAGLISDNAMSEIQNVLANYLRPNVLAMGDPKQSVDAASFAKFYNAAQNALGQAVAAILDGSHS